MPKYYTVNEVAEQLRLSYETVCRKIRLGEFGAVANFGRSYMLTQENINQFVEAHTILHGGEVSILSSPPGHRRRRRPPAPKLGLPGTTRT